MKQIEHAPYAPALVESMRAVGYSLESAIADLIDNSISAGARRVPSSTPIRTVPPAAFRARDNWGAIRLAFDKRHNRDTRDTTFRRSWRGYLRLRGSGRGV